MSAISYQCQKKKKKKIFQIYLATVQTTQHKDSSVSSVTLIKVSQNRMSHFSVIGRMPYFGHFQHFWTKQNTLKMHQNLHVKKY